METISKLSELEANALAEMDLNAGISFSSLGRKLNTSKVTASNLIERLVSRKVILGYSAVIDLSKIGYTAYGVFIKLKNITEKDYDKLITKISSHSSVHGIAECGGPYDLMFTINAEQIYTLHEVLSSLQQGYARFFQDCKISTRVTVNYYSREYLKRKMKLPREYSFSRTLRKSKSQLPLDDLDKKILNILAGNARIPITEIANKLKVARSTITNRITALESNKVIIGYLSRIQSPSYGYQVFQLRITLQNKSPQIVEQIFKWATTEPCIVHVVNVIANWDFEVTCEVPHQDELQKIIRRLNSYGTDIISDLEVALVFKLFYKYAFTI
ncbi:MAG: Lrp/AsnC family transcriptional regulator [Proteobacteria bacterium]|nr:Lrp/AsnC family transcriptional regulator [Pseudomonadota bacterium]